jgi:lipid A disaccharide synthetase
MDKLIVKELIQNALNVESIYEELALLLTNDSKRSQLKADFKALHQLLLSGGNASINAAEKIQALLLK